MATKDIRQEIRPFTEQMPHVLDVFNQAQQQFQAGGRDFYGGNTVAGQGDDTILGQYLARQGGRRQTQNNTSAQRTFLDLLKSPDPYNDPTVRRFADAATRPLDRQRYQALARDDDRAVSQGAFGGDRQALTRGQTNNDYFQAMGDVRAGIFNNAYNQQFAGQQNALNMLPQFNAAFTQPSDAYSRVGAQNDQFQQRLIDADRERFDFGQNEPLLNLNRYSNHINQFQGQTSNTQQPGATSTQNVVGGALAGLALRGGGLWGDQV